MTIFFMRVFIGRYIYFARKNQLNHLQKSWGGHLYLKLDIIRVKKFM